MGLSAARPFGIDVRRGRRGVRVTPTGELDLLTAGVVDARVGALTAAGFGQVVLDLSRIEFIDCAGVRMLVRMRNRACAEGWRLSLVRCGDSTRRVLELTRTSELLAPGGADTRHERSSEG